MKDEEMFYFEKQFLNPNFSSVVPSLNDWNVSDDIKRIVFLMSDQKYEEIYSYFQENGSFFPFPNSTDYPSLKNTFLDHLSSNEFSATSQLQVFCFGVACLQLFVARNWLGAKTNFTVKANVDFQELESVMVLDGESLIPGLRDVTLLFIAKCILHDLKDSISAIKLSKWWLLRYLHIHQRILEEPSPTLKSVFHENIEHVDFAELTGNDQVTASVLHAETAYFYLLYGEVQKAKESFIKAYDLAEFKLDWHGALGRRTRYQQQAIAQMTVRILSTKLTNEVSTLDAECLPKDLLLDDDTRLNQIAFVNEESNALPNLHPVYQAYLIGYTALMEKSTPKDELLVEQITPLLNCVLAYPKVWSLHVSALVLRSKFESDQRRTVERSMMQLQELTDALDRPSPPSEKRLEYFYVSRLPSERELHGMLADIQLSLGAVNSALDFYLRLQMWEKVIVCYQLLEMKHKAEEIVRQELAKDPTPKLWCILGDCTDDVECYEKAWELSSKTSARAQRDWAYYYYRKKLYRECIPHYQQSLAINSLQEHVWLRLAFALSEVEDWETAAGAYRRYCALNSDSFEAWNNLARCYVKLGQKNRAWKALQEAVKCNYDNWKVWDNLMIVSVDCGEFEEVIRSYHRILDLKEKHVDTQVLNILVRAINENREDSCGQPAGRLTTPAHKLFGRLTAQVTNNSRVWELYADLIAGSKAQESQTLFKVAQTLQKAYRSVVQENGWEKDQETCYAGLKICVRFGDSCLSCLSQEPSKEATQLAMSAKLSLRSVISQVKLCYGSDIPDNISQELITLETKLSSIVQLITSLQ